MLCGSPIWAQQLSDVISSMEAAQKALKSLSDEPEDQPPINAGNDGRRHHSLLDAFQDLVLDRLDVIGYRRLGYHVTSVTGDSEAYSVQNYSGLGLKHFTDIGDLSISGHKVLGVLNFSANIQDSRFRDPQNDKWTVDTSSHGFRFTAGDILGTLQSANRYANFNRTLRGIQIGYESGGFRFNALTSQARGQARTVTLNGNNSAGPYYLQASQVIADSETVQVDGVTMRRGIDYTISYEVGSITFASRTIAPSSTINVTFEAYSTNTSLGRIEGTGIQYNAGPAGTFGMTAMRQTARGTNSASTRLEKFQGFGAPSVPYTLQFEPLSTFPITVRLNGILQVEGVDYHFDQDNPAVFFFNRFVPTEDEIDVIYTPRPNQTVDGDREVLGFDYRLPIGGKAGSLSLGLAHGRLKSPINPSTGTAKYADFRYDLGATTITANARDVAPGYVGIETRSFNRNEKAIGFNIDVHPIDRPNFGFSNTNSLISIRRLDDQGHWVYFPSRVSSLNGYYELSGLGAKIPMRLDWSRQRSRVNGSETFVDSTSINASKTYSAGEIRFGVRRQVGIAPTSLIANAPRSSFSVLGLDSVVTWEPPGRWSGDLRASINATDSQGTRSTGLRQDVTLNYRLQSFLATLSHSRIDAGEINTLGGFSGGTGVGLGESGFSNGTGDFGVIGATNSLLTDLSLSWALSKRTSIAAQMYQQRYAGAVSSNSQTDGYGIAANSNFGDHRVSLAINHSRTAFLGSSTTGSSATTFNTLVEGQLTRRFSYGIRASYLLTGGGGSFGQSGGNLETNLSYVLGPRDVLSFDYLLGQSHGYLPQNDISSSVTYSYRIFASMGLNVRYRFRNVQNRDSGISSGAYRVGAFDVELTFSFGM